MKKLIETDYQPINYRIISPKIGPKVKMRYYVEEYQVNPICVPPVEIKGKQVHKTARVDVKEYHIDQ